MSEYRFDYTKSRPNRAAGSSLLRATIAALKKPGSRRAGRQPAGAGGGSSL